jgi:hypothetical protein
MKKFILYFLTIQDLSDELTERIHKDSLNFYSSDFKVGNILFKKINGTDLHLRIWRKDKD